MRYTTNLNLNLMDSDDYIEDESREAVNDNFESLDENVVVKGDFAILTGSMEVTSGTGNVTIAYPNGFTKDNCMIISTCITVSNDYFVSVSGMAIVYASLKSGGVRVYVDPLGSGWTSTGTHTVKVVLMKIS